MASVTYLGVWWLSGRFGGLHPEGRRFKSHSSRHMGTFGKFPRSCPALFGVLTLGMLKPVFWQTGFRLLKTGFKPVLLTFIKIYNYIRQIIVCITHCNVRTCKAVSTLICSFSRFSLNEAMNIVYIVFYRKNIILSLISFLILAFITMQHIGRSYQQSSIL